MLHYCLMINPDRFANSERSSFYKAIQYLDPDNEYIIADKENDILNYNGNKIKTRKRTSCEPGDRELTLAFILLLIIKQYKWPYHLIEIEPAAKGTGNSNTGALQSGICLKNENGEIIILCHIQSIYEYGDLNDVSIEEYLFYPYTTIVSNKKAEKLFCLSLEVPMTKNHFPLYCMGICTQKAETYTAWTRQGRPVHYYDFPVYGAREKMHFSYIKLPRKNNNEHKKDLDSQFDIKKVLRVWDRLWNEIWGGTLEDNKKFENFNKVLLAKIYDEQKTKEGTPYVFQVKTRAGITQTEEDLAWDIDLLYRRGYREYLAKNKNMDLFQIKGIDFKEFPPYLAAQCVRLLQSLSFCNNRYTNTDILGEFYEKIIRKAFKQTKGLFLTHPNIVLFILSALDIETMVNRKAENSEQQGDKLPFIIDPSCGTGTFLILFVQYLRKCTVLNHAVSPCASHEGNVDEEDSDNRYNRIEDHIYGIDKDEVLTRACQLNLILHGNRNEDICTHIINTDGLLPFHAYSKGKTKAAKTVLSTNITDSARFYGKPCLNKFDIVVSNPPFNTAVPRSKLQDSFTLSGKSEFYFLERWYQLLKPGGRLGVVLPESFFAVDDNLSGRMFLYRHFTIKAIVSLPNHAFYPYTNINTSLLFAVKKTGDEEIEFLRKWEVYTASFNRYVNDIIALFPEISKIEEKIEKYFGPGFFVLPFFVPGIISNPENCTAAKKTIKDLLLKNRDRWILKCISTETEEKFYNFSVRETGYKAGKKGSKNRPNQLISLYDRNNKKIYDLKYSHTWMRVDTGDKQTVLGKIKALRIWQPDAAEPDIAGSGACDDKGIVCEKNSLSHVCRFSPMRCDTHFTHYIRRAENFFSNKKIEWVALGSVLDKVQNGMNVSTSYYSMDKTNLYYLSVTQVKEYGLALRHRIYLTEETRELDNFYELEENMVIITRSGTIGIALSTNHSSFHFKNATYVPSGFLITARVKPGYSADVIAYYINLPDVQNYLNAMAAGVCQKNISQPVIKNLPIPEVLLKNGDNYRTCFAGYEKKSTEIKNRIKEKEKELIELKAELAESVKREIFEFYK